MEKPGRSREVMLARLKSEMADRKEAIRKHLETTRAILLGVVSRLSAEDWNRQVASSEGAWTAQQALAHLATAEAGQIAIGRRMLTGEARLRDDFDLNYWNQRQVEKLKGWSPAELLNDLGASRQTLLSWIDGLNEADLDKSGQHGRGDIVTVEQLCFRIGEHEAEHAKEIWQTLGK